MLIFYNKSAEKAILKTDFAGNILGIDPYRIARPPMRWSMIFSRMLLGISR